MHSLIYQNKVAVIEKQHCDFYSLWLLDFSTPLVQFLYLRLALGLLKVKQFNKLISFHVVNASKEEESDKVFIKYKLLTKVCAGSPACGVPGAPRAPAVAVVPTAPPAGPMPADGPTPGPESAPAPPGLTPAAPTTAPGPEIDPAPTPAPAPPTPGLNPAPQFVEQGSELPRGSAATREVNYNVQEVVAVLVK